MQRCLVSESQNIDHCQAICQLIQKGSKENAHIWTHNLKITSTSSCTIHEFHDHNNKSYLDTVSASLDYGQTTQYLPPIKVIFITYPELVPPVHKTYI